MSETKISYAYFESPIGRLLLAGDDQVLRLISFPSGSRTRQPKPDWQPNATPFAKAFLQLDEYFEGKRLQFSIPLGLAGTPFQNAMWTRLITIPFGATTTYGALAADLGRPAASRAVGAANGANPLPIIVPCHRVVGSNGSLTGFGGGVDVKRYLLAHEKQILATQKTASAA